MYGITNQQNTRQLFTIWYSVLKLYELGASYRRHCSATRCLLPLSDINHYVQYLSLTVAYQSFVCDAS